MKKLLNGEIVSGVLNPDGTLTDVKPVINDYDIPTEDKIGVELVDRELHSIDRKIIYIENTQESEKEVSDRVFPVYKKVWDSGFRYYSVGYLVSNEDVRLKMPKHRKPEIDEYDNYRGHPESVEKFHSAWYRDTDPTNPLKNMKVSFVPSNDLYEIVNSNKNESIGYVSFEGNVIYWNQYRY